MLFLFVPLYLKTTMAFLFLKNESTQSPVCLFAGFWIIAFLGSLIQILGTEPALAKDVAFATEPEQLNQEILGRKRMQMLRALLEIPEDAYFKTSTCREFADTVLSRHGLPLLGKNGPIKFHRGPVDRTRAKREPPEFSDSIFQKKEGSSVEISAATDKHSASWSLTLVREATDRGRTASVFQFDFGRDGTCLLKRVAFQRLDRSPNTKQKLKPFIKNQIFNLANCLDIFLVRISGNAKVDAGADALNLKADCALAVHYLVESKDAIQDIYFQSPSRLQPPIGTSIARGSFTMSDGRQCKIKESDLTLPVCNFTPRSMVPKSAAQSMADADRGNAEWYEIESRARGEAFFPRSPAPSRDPVFIPNANLFPEYYSGEMDRALGVGPGDHIHPELRSVHRRLAD